MRRRPSPEAVVSFVVVAASALFVFAALHPSKLFSTSTPAGGDMGAHVWAPYFLRHHLFPHGRLTGWAQDWYAGFPALTFYFPLPYLVIALLSYVLPYGIAFKLVSVSGVVGLPVAAWAFGRLLRMRFPGPALLAVATLPYLFDRYWTIYGGNIASTLAGEFAFSIALALSLIFLGVFSAVETGRYRALSALLLAATGLCHLLPTLFALVGALLLFLLQPSRRRIALGVTVGVVGGCVAAFWLLPFAFRLQYSNDMGWERTVEYLKNLFPWMKHASETPAAYTRHLKVVVALAAAGALGGIALRRRATILITGLGLSAAAAFRLMQQSAIWNARMLPFWYLTLYLAAAAGAAEAINAVGVLVGQRVLHSVGEPLVVGVSDGEGTVSPDEERWYALVSGASDESPSGASAPWPGADARPSPTGPEYEWGPGSVMVPASESAAGPGWGTEADGRFPGGDSGGDPGRDPGRDPAGEEGDGDGRGERGEGLWDRWFDDGVGHTTSDDIIPNRFPSLVAPLLIALLVWVYVGQPLGWWHWSPLKFGGSIAADHSYVGDWANWNYSGYQGKSSYPEYRDVIDTMARVGAQDGCGRAMWEYEGEEDRFGTPMALMLLPMWTNGCIGSMEGLFFESSATVPYHFLNQAELSKSGSEAMRGLPYRSLNVAEGIAHLRLLGVRYYMAISPEAQAQAQKVAGMHLIATTSKPYPVTYTVSGTQKSEQRQWQIYQIDDSDTVAPLAYQPVVMTHAPVTSKKGWIKLVVPWYQDSTRWDVELAASGPPKWTWVTGADPNPPRVPVRQAVVSNIRTTDDRIAFDVDQPGSPVLVKTSYFPNWQVSGGRGPWRVAPNLMVVIPTSTHVELHYGFTPIDNTGRLLTLAGLAAAGLLWRADRLASTSEGSALQPVSVAAGGRAAGGGAAGGGAAGGGAAGGGAAGGGAAGGGAAGGGAAGGPDGGGGSGPGRSAGEPPVGDDDLDRELATLLLGERDAAGPAPGGGAADSGDPEAPDAPR